MSTHFRIARTMPRFVASAPPPSGITLVSAGSAGSSSGSPSTVNVPYPPSFAAGDIIVLFGRASAFDTAQTGWTTVADITNSATSGIWLGWKVADGSESGTFSLTTGLLTAGTGQMLAFRGVDATTPIDVAASLRNTDGAASTNTPIPGITTTKTGVALIYAGGKNGAGISSTPPSSPAAFTETLDSAADPSSALGYLIWSGSGATGTVTIGWSSTGRSTGALMALRPA